MESLPDGMKADLGGLRRVARGHVAHHQERRNHARERQGIHRIHPAHAERCDHDSPDGRARDRRNLHHDGVEADRVRQMLARHQ